MELMIMITKAAEMTRRVARVWRAGGREELMARASLRLGRWMSDRYAWPERQFLLRPEDITNSAAVPRNVSASRLDRNHEPLRVGVVCFPPAQGSGGHTTLFRMIKTLQSRGHECVLYLYDRDTEDVTRHVDVIRRGWPWMDVPIRSARPRIDGIDAVLASSWETAHVVACRADRAIERYYFVQDYEPYFYPQGFLHALAEDSYRFGFKIIALGDMPAACIEAQLGVETRATVPFGCDTDTYCLLDGTDRRAVRSGVVFYAKTGADRRGYWLARRALHLFHQSHPEQAIHVVGDQVTGWSIPLTQHGSVSPRALNELYNQTIAGVSLSFTNISLVAEEMLAAGTIPVINDSPLARLGLADDGAIWAPATPDGIAAGLTEAVGGPDRSVQAAQAARTRGCSWGETGSQLAGVIEEDFGVAVSTLRAGHRTRATSAS
ncbi:glycosyltransferase family 4 protein [Microlunatus elymi]|uniref:Glycosyltransferase family 4 protein n=1 Tax=Microlunatus elymi TaxID=2596828 RepID=A0A516PTU1_9ACTN|nr:glycosyltransferase family 4 protein [Microlunatus elymi]QDP94597.1 glycosyltransferase family 4 protein [Microlunatus elymi]